MLWLASDCDPGMLWLAPFACCSNVSIAFKYRATGSQAQILANSCGKASSWPLKTRWLWVDGAHQLWLTGWALFAYKMLPICSNSLANTEPLAVKLRPTLAFMWWGSKREAPGALRPGGSGYRWSASAVLGKSSRRWKGLIANLGWCCPTTHCWEPSRRRKTMISNLGRWHRNSQNILNFSVFCGMFFLIHQITIFSKGPKYHKYYQTKKTTIITLIGVEHDIYTNTWEIQGKTFHIFWWNKLGSYKLSCS
jgi:hypothetical protein